MILKLHFLYFLTCALYAHTKWEHFWFAFLLGHLVYIYLTSTLLSISSVGIFLTHVFLTDLAACIYYKSKICVDSLWLLVQVIVGGHNVIVVHK